MENSIQLTRFSHPRLRATATLFFDPHLKSDDNLKLANEFIEILQSDALPTGFVLDGFVLEETLFGMLH